MDIILQEMRKEDEQIRLKRLMHYYFCISERADGRNTQCVKDELLANIYRAAERVVETKDEQDLCFVWNELVKTPELKLSREQKLFIKLNKIADEHPILSKIVVNMLSGILAGILANYIYNGFDK